MVAAFEGIVVDTISLYMPISTASVSTRLLGVNKGRQQFKLITDNSVYAW